MKIATNQIPVDEQLGGQMMSKMSWFALGMLSGAAVALLTSPNTGRENRQVIRRRAQQMADTVSKEGQAFLTEQRQRVNQVVDRGREEVEALGTSLSDAITQGKSAYHAAKERLYNATPSSH